MFPKIPRLRKPPKLPKFPGVPRLCRLFRLTLPPGGQRRVQLPLAIFAAMMMAAAITWISLGEAETSGVETNAPDGSEGGSAHASVPAASKDDVFARAGHSAQLERQKSTGASSVRLPLDPRQWGLVPTAHAHAPADQMPHDLDAAPAVGLRYEEDLPIEARQPGLSERDTDALAALTGVRRTSPKTSELPAWRRYAALSDEAITEPLVALVIDDLGHSSYDFTRVIGLSETMTLAFLPYTPQSDEFAERAREAGFEILVHMPMEPMDATVDPGPNALLTGLDEAELRRRLTHNLAQIEGYVGINNHMGSRFTGNASAMALVLDELNARGLLYLDSITSGRTIAPKLAETLRMPYAMRDVFIDAEFSPDFIAGQLQVLERMARAHGYAVGIAHPRPETLEALEAWLPEARARGIHFVPVSMIAAIECAC